MYARFLLTHPGYSIGKPIRNLPLMTAPTRAGELGVDFYRPPGYREILPRFVQAIFYPKDGWVIVGWMLTALAVVLALWRMGLAQLFWLVPTLGLLSTVPHALLVWDGDWVELARHSVLVAILLRVSLLMLVFFVLDRLVSSRAASRPLTLRCLTAQAGNEEGSMRKVLACCIVLAALAFVVAGCGSKEKEGEKGDTDQALTKESQAACTGSALTAAPKLPPSFPMVENATYTQQKTEGPTEVVEGYFEGSVKDAHDEYKKELQGAGYKILFDELEDHDSEVSWSGEGRTGQVALREQCGSDEKIYVHITNRPA